MYKTFIRHIYMLNQFRCHVRGTCEWPVLSLVTVNWNYLLALMLMSTLVLSSVRKERNKENSSRVQWHPADVWNEHWCRHFSQKSNKPQSFQKLKELKLMQKTEESGTDTKRKGRVKSTFLNVSESLLRDSELWFMDQRFCASVQRELLVNFLCHLLLSSHFIGTPLTAADRSE